MASWAVFAASVAAEIGAQVRGRDRVGLAVGGPVQRLAAHLVGTVVMGVGSLGAAGASAPAALPVPPASAPTSAVVVTRGVTEGVPEALVLASSVSSTTGSTTVTVQRGDMSWSLAASHLGDGVRWRELWELNRTRPQPDGGVWADPAAAVRPGWQLDLPASVVAASQPAPTPPPAPTPGQPAPEEILVQSGDNFWLLAEAELAGTWGRVPTEAEVAGY